MPDYEKMYQLLLESTQQAIDILLDAQDQCEELRLAAKTDNQPQDSFPLFPAAK